MAVLTNGPGDEIMHKENMPSTVRMRYWPSHTDHLCLRNEIRVSAGWREVLSSVMAEVGDCRLRTLDRNFRRIRCGMRDGIDVGKGRGKCNLVY